MDQYNNNFNENQGMNFDNNANAQQNPIPQEPINQADLYAPYNQPQTENINESIPQQNVYAQNIQNDYSMPQQNVNQGYYDSRYQQPNNPYANFNQQQQYSQNNQNGAYNMYSQPQQYNDAYYNQQYPTYNFQEKPKGFAIASMILGICSYLFCCCSGFISFFPSAAGLVLGIVSLKRNEDGKGMAIAGIVLSAIGILISIIAIIFTIALILEGGSDIAPYKYYY